ncbi:MAG: cobalt ECF transporter T component CbiQ [Deltaproteobacteria bacterium]|nr:cobalt ECF transporter T component CbiQ [Deltaproteobacteria bacterium]
MHHHRVERLAAGTSCVHALDPRAKLLACLGFVIAAASLPGWPPSRFAPLLVLVAAGLAAARLPWGFVLGRTLLVLPFVGLLVVLLPLTRGQDELWRSPGTALIVYREGLELALAILVKAVLAVLAVGWLVFTTPLYRLLEALRALRVPAAVVASLGFLFRYLDLMTDEGLRMRRARQARSPAGPRRLRIRSTGSLVGRLLLRTLERAERIHLAMLARGHDGELRSLEQLAWRRADGLFALLAFAALGAAALLGVWWGGAA